MIVAGYIFDKEFVCCIRLKLYIVVIYLLIIEIYRCNELLTDRSSHDLQVLSESWIIKRRLKLVYFIIDASFLQRAQILKCFAQQVKNIFVSRVSSNTIVSDC